jgi:type II secretory pathway pseudopilin PulG
MPDFSPKTDRPEAARLAGSARRRRGFTLIEAAVVTVIIGFGCVGMLELLAAGTMANSEGTELTTGINLANNIREMSLGLSFYDPQQPNVWNTKETDVGGQPAVKLYDNVMDLDGSVDTWNQQSTDPASGYQVFQPPIDVGRNTIVGYSNWAQWVKVETVSPNNVSSVLPQDPTAVTARVTVKVMHNGNEVYKMSWLAVAPKAN